MRKLFIPLVLVAAALLVLPLSAYAGGEMSNQALMEEIQALKAKLAETDALKQKINDLEARLATQEKKNANAEKKIEKVAKDQEGLGSKLADATKIKVGGALRINYANSDYNEAGKSRGGDLGFDIFRIDVNGAINDILISAQYRWYSYMDVIHHGWMGYNFSENWQGQLGITQVPFGLLPYASHNWWFSLAYYVGLEDDYDMGFKTIYNDGPWDLQMAFFKNAEWGSPSNLNRYSIDVVTSGDQQNQESNQLNARLAYTLGKGTKYTTELGLSGQYGQLYNGTTDGNGSHWAAAAHLNGNYGPFNVMLQVAKYKYDPDNPEGVSDDFVQMGAFAASFPVASEATVYIAGLAYTVPVNWGPVTSLQFYNDYSHISKSADGYEDSQLNTLGFLISANPVYVYVDWIYGKNALWVGAPADALAAGDPDADWRSLFNINIGYYF